MKSKHGQFPIRTKLLMLSRLMVIPLPIQAQHSVIETLQKMFHGKFDQVTTGK